MKTLFLLLLSTNIYAITGLEVMQKVEDASKGYIGSSSTMTLKLIDSYGQEVIREMDAQTLEEKNNEDKSIIVFSKPNDVKGTKLLTWKFDKDDNKQWLYLPKFKRIKKINSSGQSGSFMGSEFTYEDIAGQSIAKFNYKLIGEDSKFWTVESLPQFKSGYKRTISKISKKWLLAVEVIYFNKRNQEFKKSSIFGINNYNVGGKEIPQASRIEMYNILTRKRSIIEWSSRRLGLKLASNKFKSNRLK